MALGTTSMAQEQGELWSCEDSAGHKTFTDGRGRREEQRKPGVACTRMVAPIATVPAPPTRSRRPAPSGREGVAASQASFPRVDARTQRMRDGDRRRILEDELRHEEERLARLAADYNDGRPTPVAGEDPASSAYRDRIRRLAETIERARANIVALRRELALVGT